MVAGSDTTATGLTSLIYLLLSHPECLKKARAEVDEVYPWGDNAMDPSKHSKLTYLTACMYDHLHLFRVFADAMSYRNETLRVLPPSLSNGPRQVPYGSDGRVLGGQ